MTSERLPVVILPGFCSTRLEVESSEVCPSWKGQKVWLGLSNIGFSAMHAKGTWADKEALSLKNQWLQHLVLADPETESSGVRLRAVEGLAGVKFLDPDSFMGLAAEASYVFAPVIGLLEELGYVEGVDLIAASYDWRFAPSALEKRDGYFSQLIRSIETVDRSERGVVLLAHSMGNKVVSYFLEFVKKTRGQNWIDRHINLWIAAGAPHCGAPQALRSTVFGDKFGLDRFVTDSEARAFARSLSASPWLFPTGKETTPLFYLRRGGVLEIKQLSATVEKCGIVSTENKIMLTIELCWGTRKTDSLTTKSAGSFDGRHAKFDDYYNLLQFAGPEELPANATIKAIVKEKGRQHDANGSWLSRVGQNLAAGAMLVEEAAMGRKGLGVPKAYTEATSVKSLLTKSPDSEGFIEVRLPISKLASGPISAMGYGKAAEQGDFVIFHMRWLDFAGLKKHWVGSDKLWNGDSGDCSSAYQFQCPSDKAAVYEAIGAKEVMRIERCEEILNTWRRYYEEDPLYDDLRQRCPPLKKIRAVHGVNVPTEAAYALRVQTIRLKQSEILTRLSFDDEATMSDIHGRCVGGGTVHASGSNNALSGDGVVPLESLDECRNWAKVGLECELTCLQGVEHRAILADPHFHQIIRDAVLLKAQKPIQQEPPLHFSVAGTFSNWKPEKMLWDGAFFVHVLSIGSNGWESFQILLDGSWDKVFYPDVKDAGPTVPHSILGPDNHNAGKDWTIGKNRGKLLEGLLRPFGAFKVQLEITGGKPHRVTWEPFSQIEVLHAKGTWQIQRSGTWSELPEQCSATLNSELALGHSSAEMQIEQQRCRIDLLNMQMTNLATKEQHFVRRT